MNVGKSGVELCWHESSKFRKLTKVQKVELAEWNRNNPKKDGSSLKKRKAGEKNNRQTKAHVSLTKANEELITAMAESRTAEIAAMSAKIASMTGGAPPPDAAMYTVGAADSFSPYVGHYGPQPQHHEVLAKRAHVASV